MQRELDGPIEWSEDLPETCSLSRSPKVHEYLLVITSTDEPLDGHSRWTIWTLFHFHFNPLGRTSINVRLHGRSRHDTSVVPLTVHLVLYKLTNLLLLLLLLLLFLPSLSLPLSLSLLWHPCRGLKRRLKKILSNLLECDARRRWSFEKFFKHSVDITSRKALQVVLVCEFTVGRFYAAPEDLERYVPSCSYLDGDSCDFVTQNGCCYHHGYHNTWLLWHETRCLRVSHSICVSFVSHR